MTMRWMIWGTDRRSDVSLETSRWNLAATCATAALPLLAVLGGGCSPTADSPDAEGGGSGGSGGSGGTTETEEPECREHTECAGKGGYCNANGECEEYCDDSNCGEEEETMGHECQADEDCPEGEECRIGACLPIPGPCHEITMPSDVIDLQFGGDPVPAAGLAFADLSDAPGRELLVARGNTIVQVDGKSLAVAVTTEAEIGAFTTADVDGDGVLDLVVAEVGEGGAITTWLGDGTSFAATETAQPLASAHALFVADVSIDDAVINSVLALSGDDVWALPLDANGGLAAPVVLLDSPRPPLVTDFAVAEPGRAGSPAVLVLVANGGLHTSEASTSAFLHAVDAPLGASRIALGHLMGDNEEIDVLSHGDAEQFGLAINLGPTGSADVIITHSLDFIVRATAFGDFDGDGFEDVALTRTDGDGIHLAFGSIGVGEFGFIDPFQCGVDVETMFSGHALATGDVDADGDAELAVAIDDRVLLVHW